MAKQSGGMPKIDEDFMKELISQGVPAKRESQPDDAPQPGGETETALYLARYHRCEAGIARYLRRILHSPKSVLFENPGELLRNVRSSLSIELAEEQMEAAEASLTDKVLVITGGPGTGKTTVIDAIIRLFRSKKARVLLAAPTGRAAKRMSETSGLEAKTIHRLLE